MKYFRFNKSIIMFLYNIYEYIIFIFEKYVFFIIFCVVYVFIKKKKKFIDDYLFLCYFLKIFEIYF